MAHIRRIVDRFGANGNVSKRKSPGKPEFREEVFEDLRQRMEQNPRESLSRLFAQSGAPQSSYQEIVKQRLRTYETS
jgi:hypothetical protein